MKRYSFVVLTLALLFCASSVFAIFPSANGKGFPNRVGDGTISIQLFHGWTQGAAAWYHCFATNNVRIAQTDGLTLAPKLTSGQLPFSPTMFVFTNFNNQGPAFTGSPLNGVYSGTWDVFYVTWLPGTTPWVVTDPLAAAGSPPGLPTAGVQALYQRYPPGQSPAQQPTIMDCSIFAVGQISNPWRKPTRFSPPLVYRIPQGLSLDVYNKRLTIPFWNVYCQDPTTKRIHVEQVVIPDAHPASLANLVGANIAPVLLGFPSADRGLFNVISYAQDIDPVLPGIQPLKVLTNQYPVICDCPEPNGWRNTNFDYSPVTQFALLNRNYPANPIIPEVLFQTCDFIQAQVTAGNLISVLQPTPPLPAPPTLVGYPPAGLGVLWVLNSPVISGPNRNDFH